MGISLLFSFAISFSPFLSYFKAFLTMILPFCIPFSWGWSWSLPSVQCHKLPSIVLQAFCLSDLIPWIYLSLPLYNHKGFDLGHTWMVCWYLSIFTKLFLCIQFTWKGKKLMISKVPHYPAATLGFSIFCGQDLFLQIPWNMNHNSSCRKETFLKVLYLSHGLKAALVKFVKSNGIMGARWRETVSISHMR